MTSPRSTTPPRIQTATLQTNDGENDSNTDENKSADEQAVPTKFFTPNFVTQVGAAPPNPRASPPPLVTEKQSIRPIGVVPEEPSATFEEANATFVNVDPKLMGLTAEPPTSPSSNRPVTRTESGARRRPSKSGTSGLGVVLAALGALAVGAVGGVVIHKSMGGGPGTTAANPGLGRFSLDADRAAEVQLSPNMVARTPVVDVWMPSGRHSFKVREIGGTWLALEVDVKPDEPTKVKIALDTLKPAAP